MTASRTKPKGRPTEQESKVLIAKILEIAARLFKERGYAATSIEEIAAVAASGKQTIYRRFGSKELLFQAVMDAHTAGVGRRLRERLPQAGPLEALRHTTREMFDHMLSPESVALHRVLVAEAPRFPALVSRTFDRTVGPFSDLTEGLLRAAVAAGELNCREPARLFGLLTGMLTGWPHQQALLGRDVLPSAALRTRYFEAAWEVFLSGAGGAGPARAHGSAAR